MGVIGYVVKLSRSNALNGDSRAQEVKEADMLLQYTSRSTTFSSVAHKGIQSLEGFRKGQEENCTNTSSRFGAYSEAFREHLGRQSAEAGGDQIFKSFRVYKLRNGYEALTAQNSRTTNCALETNLMMEPLSPAQKPNPNAGIIVIAVHIHSSSKLKCQSSSAQPTHREHGKRIRLP